MVEQLTFNVTNISCHAWNKDRTRKYIVYKRLVTPAVLKEIEILIIFPIYHFSWGYWFILCMLCLTELALCPSNNEVHIYKRIDKSWQLTDVLNQHELNVTDIDWAPNTNRIVTSSAVSNLNIDWYFYTLLTPFSWQQLLLQDRNAYVWSQGEDGKWKPTLVLLRTNRAATCVKWSPFGKALFMQCVSCHSKLQVAHTLNCQIFYLYRK